MPPSHRLPSWLKSPTASVFLGPLALIVLLVTILSACGETAAAPAAPPIPGLASTLAAQTLTARDLSHRDTPTPQPIPDQGLLAFEVLPAGEDLLPTPTPAAPKSVEPVYNRSEEALCTNLAEFVEDVTIPDYTRLKGGQSFVKTWKFRNLGSCTWTPDYKLVFVWGDAMDGVAAQPLGVTVKPEGVIDVSVRLIAPKAANFYQGNWMFEDPHGARFGTGYQGRKFFWVAIDVGGSFGRYGEGCVSGGG